MPTTHKPLVSVVMVIRDVERFLAEAIESVLGQTFRDFEFIIVDFGSTDNSKEIAARYAASDDRVRISEIPPCSYIEAKIAACAKPRGKYIAIQDADDVSLPSRLEEEVDFLANHPEVGLVGGAVQWIDSQGRNLKTPEAYPTEDRELRLQLQKRNPFWHPTVLILAEAYSRVGGYREPSSPSDDYDLWLRISEHYQCSNLSHVVLKYRIHPQQLSLRKRKQQIYCVLAAQASVTLRATGKPDPMDSVKQITPAILAEMGVSLSAQQQALAEGYCYWIKQTYAAGEYAASVDAADEMLQLCSGGDVEPRFISDAHLTSAKASWKQRRILPSFLSATRAVLARPGIAMGALRRLVYRGGAS